jgi:hypothetical protein
MVVPQRIEPILGADPSSLEQWTPAAVRDVGDALDVAIAVGEYPSKNARAHRAAQTAFFWV